jgi:transcriptional regulator with XRE-family HTH domain
MRVAQDISQDELAHRSGFHRTYVGMLERGERSPSIDTIFDLADTLNVKPSELIAEVERAYRKASRN